MLSDWQEQAAGAVIDWDAVAGAKGGKVGYESVVDGAVGLVVD